jgi:diacylglycerol kinase (ATP)
MSSALTIDHRPPPSRRPLSQHLMLIANGNASGVGGDRAVLDGAVRTLRDRGARVEAHVTTSLDELADLVHVADRRVVLLGGDGSVHAFANVDGPKPEVALLPAGRANNIAHSLGIPIDLAGAASVAVETAARPLDVIAATSGDRTVHALEGISVGFHSVARTQYHGTNSADLRAGAKAAVKALARFGPETVAVETDGSTELLRLNQLFVVNFPLFAFGLRVAPAADPGDGLLDLVSVDAGSRASLVATLARMRSGSHIGRRGVRTWRGREIRISTAGRWPVVADTTSLGTGTVSLTVEPAAFEIASPVR